MKLALATLAQDPSGRTTGLDVKALRVPSKHPYFRLRVGPWRAGFRLRANVVEVIRIFHRDEGYGWLERRYP